MISQSALILAETRALKDGLKKKVTHDIFSDENINNNHSSTVTEKYNKIIAHLSEVYGNDEVVKDVVKDNLDYKSGIHDYSAFRVMHWVIENTLSCLTGLSKIELDKERSSNPAMLSKKVKQAIDNKTYDLHQYVTDQGIETDELRNEIVQQMTTVIRVLKEKKDTNLFEKLIRNDDEDKRLHALMPVQVIDKKDDIIKLFGVKGDYSKTDDALKFENGKAASIFQSLKDTYEVNGNITKIQEECDKSLDKLKEAESKRKEHYDEHIEPLLDQIQRIIPTGYSFSFVHSKLDYCGSGNQLSDDKLKSLEDKILSIYEEINDKKKGRKSMKI